jgi:GNAT superfamily N-acetyltransferase
MDSGAPPPAEISIEYLRDHPHLINELAKLSWNEWQPIYQERSQNFEDALNNYRGRMNTDRLPVTVVALSKNQLVGTVSLKFHDLDIRPQLDPWLGALLVLPDWRGQGIASLLMQRAVDIARTLNIAQLYLWTSSAEGLYRKLGWRVVERTEYCGKTIVVMTVTTDEALRR